MTQQARISQLFIYPVKSLKGIPVDSSILTKTGLAWDRHWMIINPDNRFMTQRQLPKLVLIKTALTDNELILSYPGLSDLMISLAAPDNNTPLTATIWKDTCQVIDEGESVSEWLTQAMESPKPLRLVRMASNFSRPQSKPEKLGSNTSTLFADATPYLVTNQASLDAVNQAMVDKKFDPVSIEHFRPNIVLDGLSAFTEHRLKTLQGPNYQLQHCYPCQRCVVPTINVDTGTRHPQQQPFSIVAELNAMPDNIRVPAFGENAILTAGSGNAITVGDSVTVE